MSVDICFASPQPIRHKKLRRHSPSKAQAPRLALFSCPKTTKKNHSAKSQRHKGGPAKVLQSFSSPKPHPRFDSLSFTLPPTPYWLRCASSVITRMFCRALSSGMAAGRARPPNASTSPGYGLGTLTVAGNLWLVAGPTQLVRSKVCKNASARKLVSNLTDSNGHNGWEKTASSKGLVPSKFQMIDSWE